MANCTTCSRKAWLDKNGLCSDCAPVTGGGCSFGFKGCERECVLRWDLRYAHRIAKLRLCEGHSAERREKMNGLEGRSVDSEDVGSESDSAALRSGAGRGGESMPGIRVGTNAGEPSNPQP